MAGPLRVPFSDQAQNEVNELETKERAKVYRNAQEFLSLVHIPGGKAERVRKAGPGTPAIDEFKVNVKDHWIRLLFTTAHGARVVLVCVTKKSNRLREADVELALARAKFLGL